MKKFVNALKKEETMYDIYDARIPDNMEPGRKIVLDESLSFDEALTMANVGDMIVDATTSIEIVVFKEPNSSARTLYLSDDETTMYNYTWSNMDGLWISTGEYYLASTNYVDDEVNKKANLITLTEGQTLLSVMNIVHKGDIVKDISDNEFAWLCCYDCANIKKFITVDDTNALAVISYTKTGNTWTEDVDSWDFNPNSLRKFYRHHLSFANITIDGKDLSGDIDIISIESQPKTSLHLFQIDKFISLQNVNVSSTSLGGGYSIGILSLDGETLCLMGNTGTYYLDITTQSGSMSDTVTPL